MGGNLQPDDHLIPVDPDLDPADPAQPDEISHVRGSRVRDRGAPRRADPGVLAAIAGGGMLGASARYGIARWVPTAAGRFPWATFWTNLSGSFLLGLLLVLVLERLSPTRYLRPFLATGVLGAYTTMSTYEVEITLLVKDGHAPVGVLYGLGSLAAGLVLAAAGIAAGRRWGGHRRTQVTR